MKLLIVTQKVDKNDSVLGFVHQWIEEFSKYAERVKVIAGFVGAYTFPPNVRIYSLGKEQGAGRWSRIVKYAEFFSIHYVRCDATLFHMCPEFVLGASPFLIARHRVSALWYAHKSVSPALRIAEGLVDYIFTASDLSFRLPSKKVIYTGHAVPTDLFYPSDNLVSAGMNLRILSVGRIAPVKNLETLIRACGILKQGGFGSWALSLVGGAVLERDRHYLVALKKLIKDLGVEGHIHFDGPHPYDEIPDIYREHDMFISMSTTGSIDKSVLEAMSSGLTVITANEAFQSLLPPVYFLENRSPEFLAERIRFLAYEKRPNSSLRDLVVQTHGLSKTVQKIIGVLDGS